MKRVDGGRRRVLHVITRLVVGGAQDNTLLTCEGHDRRRWDVHVASNPDGPLLSRARSAADVFHAVRSLVAPISPHDDARALQELTALFRRERFDLVHLHSSKAGLLGRIAARRTGTPAVFTYHGFSFHEFMPPWKRSLLLTLERIAKPWADFYITLSENDRRAGIDLGFLPLRRSRAVYTGIDLERFESCAGAPIPRSRIGVADDSFLIMFVGRMDPQKAPDILVRAFARIRRSGTNAELVFVGDGELLTATRELARDLGVEDRVHFLGERTDVPDLLRAADVFAFSSRWEAMGRAMIEAMLSGVPVIAPAIYGIPEVVRHGETGLLYPLADEARLAEGLEWYLEHPVERAAIAERGRRLVRGRFDHREMVSRIEAIYEEVLAARQ